MGFSIIYNVLPSGEGVCEEGAAKLHKSTVQSAGARFLQKAFPLFMVPLPVSGSGGGVYRQRCCSTSPPPAARGSCKSHHVTSHFSKAGDVMQHDEDAVWCVLLQQARKNICHQYFCFSSIRTWLLFLQVPVLFFFHIFRHPAVSLLSYTDCHGQSVCPTDARKSREISTK